MLEYCNSVKKYVCKCVRVRVKCDPDVFLTSVRFTHSETKEVQCKTITHTVHDQGCKHSQKP